MKMKKAMEMPGASAGNAGIPGTTHYLVHLRASQINGCSVCPEAVRDGR